MDSTIDVLIPVYNGEKYIKKCLESIQRQTYKNINIIVLDDGSKDNTLDIIKEVSNSDNRVKYYTKENGKFVSVARNYLLNVIESEYFIFVDSDDYVSPYYIENLYKALIETNASIACCEYTLLKVALSNSKKLRGVKVYNSQDAIYEFVLGFRGHFMLWNKLIKTSLIKGIHFNEKIHYGEDMFFVLDLLYNGNIKVVSIKNRLYYYKALNFSSISKGGLNDNKKAFLEELIRLESINKFGDKTYIISTWIYLTALYYSLLVIPKWEEKEYKKYLFKLMEDRDHFIKEDLKKRLKIKK